MINIVDRLSSNMLMFNEEEKNQLWKRYYEKVDSFFDNEPIFLLDNSDIDKRSSKKLEDLDEIVDASSKDKKIVPGHHVCEAVVLGKREKQPISTIVKSIHAKVTLLSQKRHTL